MLTLSALYRTIYLIVFTSITLGLAASPSFAGQNGFNNTCSSAGSVVSCAASQPGVPGTGGSTTQAAATTNTTPPPCPWAPFATSAPPPPGTNPDGAWYVNTCDTLTAAQAATATGPDVTWVPYGQTPTITPPDPAILATQAANQLPLPPPTPAFAPATTGYVNFPEWLWINPTIWHPITLTVSASNAAGTTTITLTATPTDVIWNMGDAPTPPTICDNPGVAYNPTLPAKKQTSPCTHTYTTSSFGQPSPTSNTNNDAYPITVTLQWHITWTGTTGASGTIPDINTTTHTTLRVEQIETTRCAATCPPPT